MAGNHSKTCTKSVDDLRIENFKVVNWETEIKYICWLADWPPVEKHILKTKIKCMLYFSLYFIIKLFSISQISIIASCA
jgi:hypothetical protein